LRRTLVDVIIITGHFPVSKGLVKLRKLQSIRCKCLMRTPKLLCSRNVQSLELGSRLGGVGIILARDLIERLSNLCKLKKLRRVELKGCPKLRPMEGRNSLESLKYLETKGSGSLELCCSMCRDQPR